MSQINVNRIKDSNEGAPDFPSGVNVSGVTSTVTLGVTNLNTTNANVSGVVTATTFDGSLLATGTPTLGLGVTINASGLNISGVATAGIVSATTLYGDGTNITGIALSIAPLNYNPALNSQASHLTKALGIGLTFNQGVKAGSGNVTLSLANAGVAGTVVENFGVGNSVTYSNGDTITITPTADLSVGQNYHLSYPSGAFTNIGGDLSYVGTAYTFQARTYTYQLWAWGWPNNGNLGQNSRTYYSSPVQIPGTTWVEPSPNRPSYVNENTTGLFAKTDGTLWIWGPNSYGNLGLNQPVPSMKSSPTQIPGTTWSGHALASTSNNTAAVKTDGTLWIWGRNTAGQLGQNSVDDNRSSPTQVPGTTWSKVTLNEETFLALKTDGTIWSCGGNDQGSLGVPSTGTDKRSSPIQVPGTNWRTVTTIYRGGLATKTDGTLWMWGYNTYGQLGQNNKTNYSSPVQVPGTNWSEVTSAGYNSPIAIKTDGTMWSWGYNASGSLGLNQGGQWNTAPHQSSPVQIPGTTWSTVSKSHRGGTAIKTDGTMWVWGYNENGNLGLNNRTQYSSPVQVPGTTWSNSVGQKYGVTAFTKI